MIASNNKFKNFFNIIYIVVEPLDEIIKKVEKQIVRTVNKYEEYATVLEGTYEYVKRVDIESILLLWNLIKTMESIPDLYTELKTHILSSIYEVALDTEIYLTRRKEIIQNLKTGMKILTNEKVLRKMNELYSLILDGKIPLPNFDKYLEDVRNWAYRNGLTLDQETQMWYAQQEVVYDYLKVIIKGLLMDPTKYESLYKQLIETDNLGEFVKNLSTYIKS
jgi:hypothetical protein